ncbi:MAG TPA: FecR protein, partial [Paraburkholderia sp.]
YKAGATGGAGGLPGQNVRIVQSHVPGRPPGVAAGAPVPGAPNSGQQAINQPGRGGGPQARPGMPQVWGNVPPQSGMTGHASNGVPRPPQANGGSAGFVQQHGMPQQPGQPQGQQAAMNARHEPAWTQPHMPMAQQAQQVQQSPQRGGDVSRAPRPAVAQPPRPVEGQAPQQARQEYGGQQANREFQTRPQPQAQQAPRQEFHPQTQPRPEPAPQPQVQQAPRQEFHPQPQPRPEPRPQPQAQQAPRQEFHPQPAPHFEPRPEPRPQPQAQQPHAQPQPQPQRGEQHSGGGHDEHHRG